MKGIFCIILACFFWASDTLIRYPMVEQGISPLTIVFLEHLILVVLFSYQLFKNSKNILNLKLSEILMFFIVGSIGSGLSTLAFTRAFHYLNPSVVILLQKFQPVVAILLARIVLQETINRQFIYCALICVLGAGFIAHVEIASFFTEDNLPFEKSSWGYLFVAISVLGWGATTVFGKKISMNNFSTAQIMSGRYFFGLLFLTPLFFASQVPMIEQTVDFIKISVMVVITGLVGMFFYYLGMKTTSARNVALTEMFFPFCAVIVNWLFLGKALTILQLIGGGMLLLGSGLIQMRKY